MVRFLGGDEEIRTPNTQRFVSGRRDVELTEHGVEQRCVLATLSGWRINKIR